MTDWTWEYLPDAEHVVGGLRTDVVAQVEDLAQRLADAAAVRYLGDPSAEQSGVSRLLDYAEGRLIVWYQEHWRLRTVFVTPHPHLKEGGFQPKGCGPARTDPLRGRAKLPQTREAIPPPAQAGGPLARRLMVRVQYWPVSGP